MIKFVSLLSVLAILLQTNSCQDQQDAAQSNIVDNSTSMSVEQMEPSGFYDVVSIYDNDYSQLDLNMHFEGNRLSGYAGCNSYSTTINYDDGFSSGPVMATKRYCDKADYETQFFQALSETSYLTSTNDDQLTLHNSDGKVIMKAVKPKLIGSYTISKVKSNDLEEAGLTMNISKEDNYIITGSSGCNRYNGSFDLLPDGIDMGIIASTEMACTDNQEIEKEFITALYEITGHKFTTNGLLFTDMQGNEIITLKRSN
ncbi:META domain-containing protein [Nonlabens ponticola]|uniref:META domain-containing protein n=1 Tax=Nonlabens ponticola TaxID=2496866 RepID=A0A3S9MV50_9FLAO|nr:META domain-containing protein [Nonlabens ponticola]AZQ43048.1 META domain-containing protein [Nonlabens ponticola]